MKSCGLKHLLLLVSVFLVVTAVTSFAELAPFTSDGCSSFPDGTLDQRKLWYRCCTAHDYSYWKGGTYGERMGADKALQRCVASVGEEEIALLMLAGVRVGGTPFLPTPFRWGYGWPFPRPYGPLSTEELEEVKEREKEQQFQEWFFDKNGVMNESALAFLLQCG